MCVRRAEIEARARASVSFFRDDSLESDGCDAESGDDVAGAGAGVRIFIGWTYFAV